MGRFRQFVVFCLLFLLIPTLDNANAATISGRVLDEATDQPIANTQVGLFDGKGKRLGQTKTDTQGSYSFSDLAAGTFYVLTEKSQNYVDEFYPGEVCGNFCYSGNYIDSKWDQFVFAEPFVVSANDAKSNIDFHLSVGGAFAGRVVDGSTEIPLADIYVHIYDITKRHLESVKTDTSGVFRSSAFLPSGKYFVVIRPSDTRLESGTESRYLDQVVGAGECLVNQCWDFPSSALIEIRKGEVSDVGDVSLTTGFFVSGYVLNADTDEPYGNLYVSVTNGYARTIFGNGNLTDSNGSFRIGPLPEGRYLVEAPYDVADLVVCDAQVDCGDRVVDVRGDVDDVNFYAQTGGQISGKVFDSGTGNGIASAFVEIYGSDEFYRSRAYVDYEGNFSSSSFLPTGSYIVRAIKTGAEGYISTCYNNVPCPGDSTLFSGDMTSVARIAVEAGKLTPNIDIAMSKGAVISGLITQSGDETGHVSVVIEEINSGWKLRVHRDEDGYYTSGPTLPDGEYRVMVSDLYPGTVLMEYEDKKSHSSIVKIKNGQSQNNIDIVASDKKVVAVYGKIVERTSEQPLAAFPIFIANHDGGSLASSDAFGRYVGEVEPGKYNFYAYGLDNYVSETSSANQCMGDYCIFSNEPTHELSETQISARFDYALSKGGGISGRIVDMKGDALPFVSWVGVFDDLGNYVTSGFTDRQTGIQYNTNNGLLPGTYYALVNPYPGESQFYENLSKAVYDNNTTLTPIVVEGVNLVENINFTIQSGFTISGQVMDVGSNPVSGIRVDIVNHNGYVVTNATTNLLGLYETYDELPSGSYYVITQADLYQNQAYGGAEFGKYECEYTFGLCKIDISALSDANLVTISDNNVSDIKFSLTKLESPKSSGDGGGGAIGYWLLALLSLITGLRRKCGVAGRLALTPAT